MRLKATPGICAELVYAWAEEEALLRRYTETRRRHPWRRKDASSTASAEEEVLTRPLRDEADLVLDTSELPLAELRRRIEQRFRPGHGRGRRHAGLTVSFVSFAFPAGLPREADMVFDARFLRNPHYDPILRPGTGLDPEVAAYVEADPDFERFFQSLLGLLTLVIPRFVQEGKKYADDRRRLYRADGIAPSISSSVWGGSCRHSPKMRDGPAADRPSPTVSWSGSPAQRTARRSAGSLRKV